MLSELGAIVLLAYCPLVYIGVTRTLGKDDDWWNPMRRVIWPILDKLFEKLFGGYAAYDVVKRSRVGRYDMTADELEAELYELGYYKNPIAALKRRPWRNDVAKRSLAKREIDWFEREWMNKLVPDIFATWQVHVTIFENADGTAVAFAHREHSSINPLTLHTHYGGDYYEVCPEDVEEDLKDHGVESM